MRLIVQAIIVTTPIGFLLTNYLGPMLLYSKPQEDNESSKYLFYGSMMSRSIHNFVLMLSDNIHAHIIIQFRVPDVA